MQLTILSCYGSIPLTLGLIGRDVALSTFVSQFWVCLSAEGAKNISWSWLALLQRWVSLTMAFTGKFIYIYIYIYIYVLCHRSRWSSYLPRWSQDYLLPLAKINQNCGKSNSGNKNSSVKTLKIGLYSVFLNKPIKHVQEKEKKKKRQKFYCKRKRTFFCLNFSAIATLKKQRPFSMSTCFLSTYLG